MTFPAEGGSGPHYVGCDAFATIQGGVDRVAVGGEVDVKFLTSLPDESVLIIPGLKL